MTPIQVYGLYRYTRPMITYGGIQTPRICSVIGENELRAILCKWCAAQKHHAVFRSSMPAARSIMNRLFVGVLCCVVFVCLFVCAYDSRYACGGPATSGIRDDFTRAPRVHAPELQLKKLGAALIATVAFPGQYRSVNGTWLAYVAADLAMHSLLGEAPFVTKLS